VAPESTLPGAKNQDTEISPNQYVFV